MKRINNVIIELRDYIKNKKSKRDKADRKISKSLYLITITAVVLILIVVIKDAKSGAMYLYDSEGNAVGIERKDENMAETFKLVIHIFEKDKVRNKNVVINKRVKVKESSKNDDKESVIDAEIESLITDIELSNNGRMMLPDRLSDGTRLVWEPRDSINMNIIYIIIGYILLVLILLIDERKRPKDEANVIRREVLNGLPRFVNQLLMLLNSGMILSDALRLVCDSYKIIPEENRSYFEKQIIEVNERYSDGRISTTSRIFELAKETNVKELIRIASILSENERRGSNIVDNLSRESSFLWEDRKIIAKERGRIIDTKMSYPMGILLVLLIVITMAPAMLTM